MAPNLPIPKRPFTTDTLLKTCPLHTANPRPKHSPSPTHPLPHSTTRTKAYKPKTPTTPLCKTFPEKIPISAVPTSASIIRKFDATPRSFDEGPIGNARGRSLIHKYGSTAKLPFPEEMSTSGVSGFPVVHRYNAMPDPRLVPKKEKEDASVRRVGVTEQRSGEEEVEEMRRRREVIRGRSKAFLDGKGGVYGSWKVNSLHGRYMRQTLGDANVKPSNARSAASASRGESVRHASTVAAGKRELKPVEMDVERYHKVADKYIDELVGKLEQVQEEREDVDVEYSSGVLTLLYPPNGTYVLNKQPPNKQIWLSSPISGPKRYDYVVLPPENTIEEGEGGKGGSDGNDGVDKGGGKGEKGEWMYLRDESTLSRLLEEEVGVRVVGDGGEGEG